MCRWTCEGLCSLHFDERHVAVVGIELWCHHGFCPSGGEACVVSIKVAQR